MKRLIFITLSLFMASLYATETKAQDKTVKKIIELGQSDNHTMQHENMLANVIGGRPIGSHSLEDAEKWVAKQFRSWGLEVMEQEVGEINVGFSRGPWWGKMIGDGEMTLHFGTPTYTAGTKGPQRGHVLLEPKTKEEFEHMKGALKGAWVLVDGSTGFAINSSHQADSIRQSIICKNDSINLQNEEIKKHNLANPSDKKKLLETKTYPVLFYREMKEAGVLGFIQSVKAPIQVLSDRLNYRNITMETLPTVCDIKLEEAQYNIIKEKVLAKKDILLEFDIRNHFFEGPVKYHNIIGILRGSKYPDEYVLTGGHLDAYDTASGAVDDGQGVSVTMESARLLATAGAKPKRSIMFTIWTGEENGLLGSKYFVENKTVPMEKISNYFNRDGGPEVAVGITVPEAMYDDFSDIAKPLANLSPEFPFTVSKRLGEPGPRPTKGGSSDYAYFARNGVPTLSLTLKDVKGYNFSYREIWHSDRDLYNKAYPDYLEHSSLVNAVMVYGVANLDHLLNRQGLYKEEEKTTTK